MIDLDGGLRDEIVLVFPVGGEDGAMLFVTMRNNLVQINGREIR